jgi:rSAM/selenodomain-associated transferase 1
MPPAPGRPVAIVLYARAPRRGRVKTRLVPPLTPDAALALHRALVRDAAVVVGRAARASGARPFVAWSAPGPHLRLTGLRRLAQGRGDLGQRMRRTVLGLLGAGHAGVVIVGSDAPLVGASNLAAAARAIRSGAPVVIGPAPDGGYYLIGLRADRPEIFAGIPWGTARVLSMTLERLRRIGVRAHCLAPARDVDRPADLAWLRRALGGAAGRRAPRTAAWLRGRRDNRP